jgi:hypothetical protein
MSITLHTEAEVIDFLESLDGYGLATVDHDEIRLRLRDVWTDAVYDESDPKQSAKQDGSDPSEPGHPDNPRSNYDEVRDRL